MLDMNTSLNIYVCGCAYFYQQLCLPNNDNKNWFAGSYHCSNGRCINTAFKCDKEDDCGDWSDELDCPNNCHYYMASSGDVVESPNYPQKYEPLSNCKWTLEGPQGHNILLQVIII